MINQETSEKKVTLLLQWQYRVMIILEMKQNYAGTFDFAYSSNSALVGKLSACRSPVVTLLATPRYSYSIRSRGVTRDGSNNDASVATFRDDVHSLVTLRHHEVLVLVVSSTVLFRSLGVLVETAFSSSALVIDMS